MRKNGACACHLEAMAIRAFARSRKRDTHPRRPRPPQKRQAGCGLHATRRRFAFWSMVPAMTRYDDTTPPAPASGGSISARARAAASPACHLSGRAERRAASCGPRRRRGRFWCWPAQGRGRRGVLTTRIAHLIATGKARPFEILSVTFTNKAAREMKERIAALIGEVGEGMPWLGTFHSISAKILRRHAELVDLRSDFTILATDDQLRLFKQILQAEGIDEKRWPPRQLAGLIDSWKNRGLGPDKGAARRGRGLRAWARGRALCALPAAPERRSTPPISAISCSNACGCGARIPIFWSSTRTASATCWWTSNQDTKCRAVSLAAADRAKAQEFWPVSAMTTSRSMAGAGPRSTNILRFEHDFPGAHPWCGWSAITAPPDISSPPPRISSPSMKAVSARPCTRRTSPARRSPSPGPGIRARRRAPSARRSRRCRPTATRCRRSPVLVPRLGARCAKIDGSLRPARAALSRHRRPALLRARRDPRCAGLSALR